MTIEGMINAQRAMMKVLGIKLDEEPASWVTINGNHIPLNEEGRAIGGNPKALGGNPRVFGKSGRKTKDDFKPKNSYTDTDKYKETLKNFKEAWEKSDAAWDERKDLEEKLKKESRPKPRSEWDDHDEFMSIMGERPMIYTEEGERLKERLDKVKDEAREYHAKRDEYEKALRGMREEAAQKQRRDYKQQDLIPVQQEEYEGFTTKKTSNSFGDEYLENGRGVICEMSPKEYLERCAYEIFSGTMETTLNGVDDEIANGYAEQMRSGVKFDLPYLNYRDSGQEGRHRAVAAYKAGIDKISGWMRMTRRISLRKDI